MKMAALMSKTRKGIVMKIEKMPIEAFHILIQGFFPMADNDSTSL